MLRVPSLLIAHSINIHSNGFVKYLLQFYIGRFFSSLQPINHTLRHINLSLRSTPHLRLLIDDDTLQRNSCRNIPFFIQIEFQKERCLISLAFPKSAIKRLKSDSKSVVHIPGDPGVNTSASFVI